MGKFSSTLPRAPLLIPFGIPTQVFFSDTRHQKQSLASLNEYFGNAVAGKKPKLGNKMELLEVPLISKTDITKFLDFVFLNARAYSLHYIKTISSLRPYLFMFGFA